MVCALQGQLTQFQTFTESQRGSELKINVQEHIFILLSRLNQTWVAKMIIMNLIVMNLKHERVAGNLQEENHREVNIISRTH